MNLIVRQLPYPQEFVLARAIQEKAEISEAQNSFLVPKVLSNKLTMQAFLPGVTTCFQVEKLALNIMQ